MGEMIEYNETYVLEAVRRSQAHCLIHCPRCFTIQKVGKKEDI